MKSTATSKGQRTRERIVERSAALMNHQGFLAAPMAAVVQAAGIQKGGLYRHFESREALAGAAFDFAVAQVRERLLQALQGQTNACDQLKALLQAYDGGAAEVPLAGGCPIMNTAIEADYADPALRSRAREAMSQWHDWLRRIVRAGIKAGQIRAGTDAQQVASVFIAAIEGAVMLTHLYGDTSHLQAVRQHLEGFIERELRVQPGEST
jgi:AcrR family transcriptional regulator